MSSAAHNAGRFDVLAIGNAIVDVLARCEDQFLADNKLPKAICS